MVTVPGKNSANRCRFSAPRICRVMRQRGAARTGWRLTHVADLWHRCAPRSNCGTGLICHHAGDSRKRMSLLPPRLVTSGPCPSIGAVSRHVRRTNSAPRRVPSRPAPWLSLLLAGVAADAADWEEQSDCTGISFSMSASFRSQRLHCFAERLDLALSRTTRPMLHARQNRRRYQTHDHHPATCMHGKTLHWTWSTPIRLAATLTPPPSRSSRMGSTKTAKSMTKPHPAVARQLRVQG